MGRRRKKQGPVTRLFEGATIVVLMLIVLFFGYSIRERWAPRVGAEVKRQSEAREAQRARELRDDSRPTGESETGPEDPSRPTALAGGVESGPIGAGANPAGSEPIRIEVRNGCAATGLARDMAHFLRRAGFDVVEWRDADRYDYEKTLILERSGRPGAGAKVQAQLQREFGVGVVEARVVEVPEADVQVILGADLRAVVEARQKEPADEAPTPAEGR